MKSDCRVVAVIRRLHIRISRLGFQKWAKRHTKRKRKEGYRDVKFSRNCREE